MNLFTSQKLFWLIISQLTFHRVIDTKIIRIPIERASYNSQAGDQSVVPESSNEAPISGNRNVSELDRKFETTHVQQAAGKNDEKSISSFYSFESVSNTSLLKSDLLDHESQNGLPDTESTPFLSRNLTNHNSNGEIFSNKSQYSPDRTVPNGPVQVNSTTLYTSKKLEITIRPNFLPSSSNAQFNNGETQIADVTGKGFWDSTSTEWTLRTTKSSLSVLQDIDMEENSATAIFANEQIFTDLTVNPQGLMGLPPNNSPNATNELEKESPNFQDQEAGSNRPSHICSSDNWCIFVEWFYGENWDVFYIRDFLASIGVSKISTEWLMVFSFVLLFFVLAVVVLLVINVLHSYVTFKKVTVLGNISNEFEMH